MLDLAGLWELEKHYDNLSTMRNQMKLLQESTELRRMEREIRVLEERFEDLLVKRKDLKLHIRKLEQEVDVHKDKYKSAEVNLYNGSVKDLKQLDHLEREKEYHLSLVDSLEDEIIDTMGISEETEAGISEGKSLLSQKRKDLVDKQKLFDKANSDLSDRIELEEKTIGDLESDLDEKLLSIYHDIRKRKGTGIAQVRNEVCKGCNMHLPEKIVEKAKQGKSVATCESCGRILYHEMDMDNI